jgi:hypothetical protein
MKRSRLSRKRLGVSKERLKRFEGSSWKSFQVEEYDDSFMDKRTNHMASKYHKAGKLFGINGFLIFELPNSLRVVGEHESFDKPTVNLRTKDLNKVFKVLNRKNGGQAYSDVSVSSVALSKHKFGGNV